MSHRCSLFRAVPAAGAVAVAATVLLPWGAAATTSSFFSRNYAAYARPENLTLMREGRVMMEPHGITSIEGFSWDRPTPGVSVSWTMDIEEMLYLLPFIASDAPDDNDFAIDWFRRWYVSHADLAAPNPVAWDRMTTGMRAAVLAYFLCRERGRPGGGISDELTAALELHRRSLMGGVFDHRSNHGLWDAIGLLEIGRVLPDAEAMATGLDRVRLMTTEQVTGQGFHLEHAPQYHFTFLQWLDEAVATLTGDEVPIADLHAVSARMVDAGYFLQDHSGLISPIGDSSRQPALHQYQSDAPPLGGDTRFDAKAGYACFKEPSRWQSGRQAVFNIQPRTRDFPYHFHDDALAVIMSYRGELIFADQGSYDYGSSQYRRLMLSAASHNIVGPARYVFGESSNRAKFGCAEGAEMHDGADLSFVARRNYGDSRFTRVVTLPRSVPAVVVDDEIEGRDMVMVWNLGRDIATVVPDDVVPAEGWFESRWLLLTRSGRVFELSLVTAEGAGIRNVRVLRGSLRPMIGWYSASYREVAPSNVLIVDIDAPRPVCVRTTLRLLEDIE